MTECDKSKCVVVAQCLDSISIFHVLRHLHAVWHGYVAVELGIGTQSGEGSDSRAQMS